MLRYKTETRPGLVALYDILAAKTERVNSYNPRARMGHLRVKHGTGLTPLQRNNSGWLPLLIALPTNSRGWQPDWNPGLTW